MDLVSHRATVVVHRGGERPRRGIWVERFEVEVPAAAPQGVEVQAMKPAQIERLARKKVLSLGARDDPEG
jgi:hypothetical protein